MPNFLLAPARTRKSTTMSEISFATLNDMFKATGFLGDVSDTASPLHKAHNFEFKLTSNASFACDVIPQNDDFQVIGGNDVLSEQLVATIHVSTNNMRELITNKKINIVDSKHPEVYHTKDLNAKFLKNWYDNLILTFDVSRHSSRSLNTYFTKDALSVLCEVDDTNMVSRFNTKLLDLYITSINAPMINEMIPYPCFAYKKQDTYHCLPSLLPEFRNNIIYGNEITGFVFKLFKIKKGSVLHHCHLSNFFTNPNTNEQAYDHIVSTVKEDTIVSVLAGLVYSTTDGSYSFLPNHNAYNRLTYIGLPYIRISEGGADEGSYYADMAYRTTYMPQFFFTHNHTAGNYLARICNHERHARSWLLSSGRSLVDSVLTTVFNSAAGATLAGGLSADVVALLARYNMTEVICAYTPVLKDPINDQLTPGHFCGSTIMVIQKDNFINNLYITTRNSSKGREIPYVVHENGVSVGNYLVRENNTFKICDKYDASYERHFYIDYNDMTYIIDERKSPSKNAREKLTSMWK